MKILMVNKFLHPRGGAETYVFRLGESLQEMGHEVQYFGMEHPDRIAGNRVGAYTGTMDFHGASRLVQLTYPFRILYSVEARRKIRRVLEDFQPDICHINNFHYQLTPSILLEIRKWSRERKHPCKIISTAHDYQLVCPNHLCCNPNTCQVCEHCLGGRFWNCVKGKCIHGSFLRSVLGALEAYFWNGRNVYREIDAIVCCSRFLKTKLDTNPVLAEKTVVLHNFVEQAEWRETEKKDYVLYFGRYAGEKGIGTLVEAARRLPEIPFVFAGSGPEEKLLEGITNIYNVGFQKGAALEKLIREARLTVCPSEWYENCPFSVLESQMLGTPVLGADIGGLPELIQGTGELFESGNMEQLVQKLLLLWHDERRLAYYTAGCRGLKFDTLQTYTEKILWLYQLSPAAKGEIQ